MKLITTHVRQCSSQLNSRKTHVKLHYYPPKITITMLSHSTQAKGILVISWCTKKLKKSCCVFLEKLALRVEQSLIYFRQLIKHWVNLFWGYKYFVAIGIIIILNPSPRLLRICDPSLGGLASGNNGEKKMPNCCMWEFSIFYIHYYTSLDIYIN